ncbi:hypothetical protein [Streptomyces brasiliscabiei]|uniref:hypothetical protein n=1 Tax=Streptomyces brasiliscabiei TaxID=2736302 RepID=UPI001C11F841|nr:hypothetical protein [Streptomyces brasiliscabiei]
MWGGSSLGQDAGPWCAVPGLRRAQLPLPLVIGFAEQLSWALYQPDRKENSEGWAG